MKVETKFMFARDAFVLATMATILSVWTLHSKASRNRFSANRTVCDIHEIPIRKESEAEITGERKVNIK